MRCGHCGKAELVPATVAIEETLPNGAMYRGEADGFHCPACQNDTLWGRDAERITSEIHELSDLGSEAVAAAKT
jgi:hypothetical protein